VALSLAVFSWLLTFHPTAAGRTYVAYGGVYVCVAIGWLWLVEKQTPTIRDVVGVAICLVGTGVIATAPTLGRGVSRSCRGGRDTLRRGTRKGSVMAVSRETLFEEVWKEPMTTVAKRYDVSSNFLARICERLNVPRPARGYALRDMKKPIGVSAYKLLARLPTGLRGSLPTVQELEAELSAPAKTARKKP
jgi:hypothetical protein